MRSRVLAVLLLLALPLFAEDEVTLARLATLGRIWGTVRYAHPALGTRNIDWDQAAVRAIERTRSAASEAEFADAVDEMLATLGDRATRVAPRCVETQTAPTGTWRTVRDGAVFVQASASVDTALKDAVRAAKNAIIDLRVAPGRCSSATLSAELIPLLFRGSINVPGHRKVQHTGYKSQAPNDTYTGYRTSYLITDRGVILTGTQTSVERVTFVVDERSTLPVFAAALVADGRAAIVSAGPWQPGTIVARQSIDFGEWTATVRTSDLADPFSGKRVDPTAITVSADASDDTIIAAALDGVTSGRRRSAGLQRDTTLHAYAWKYDETYRTMHYPPVEYRVLGAFCLWNIIDLFYPYKPLIGDWDAQFVPILALMIDASSQQEYDLAIAKAMTLVPDGHSTAITATFLDLRGRAAAPFRLMPVEGKPVVVEITGASATEAGVKPGDELVSIDGAPVAERLALLKQYISASTPSALEYYATASLPGGPAGTTPRYTFRKPDGTLYDATLARGSYVVPDPAKSWRVLPGNIGYVDLRYLEAGQVATMLNELQNTKGLIFDIRNYPRGVFPELARRLQLTGSRVLSQIRVPDVVGGRIGMSYTEQNLGPGSQMYKGKTLALIDERAQSQSEHTCLTLESLAGTKFVGTPTVGANGNVTYMVLPGSNYVLFTGMDVRHADGRQLQRVGILPDYPVSRSIQAFAAGRDEVLERAVEILSQ